MSTAIALPTAAQLPAHLLTSEAAAQIAKANADAAGGIRTGGFPKVSIEGGKFHEIDASIDGGAPRTYMVAALAGQPPLPMMCLEAVIIAANPALVKTYYAAKWVKGSAEAPDCQSSNGVTPDPSILKPQSAACATCPQNQWGSKISEASGKEVKACSDSKQMVILPGADLNYKALGLAVTPSALGDWGKYVKALSERNIPVNSVVTNITFDHTASYPKLKFAYNRFLTPEEYALVVSRAEGDDVKAIVSPSRTIALPSPSPAGVAAGAAIAPPPAAAPLPPPALVAPAGFGAATAPAAVPAAVAPAGEPVVKRTRRTREQIAADDAAAAAATAPAEDLSHLPPAIKAAVESLPAGSPGRVALMAQFPKPTATTAAAPAAATPPPAATTTPATGFGATTAAAGGPTGTTTAAAAGTSAAGASLKELLAKKLAGNKPA